MVCPPLQKGAKGDVENGKEESAAGGRKMYRDLKKKNIPENH